MRYSIVHSLSFMNRIDREKKAIGQMIEIFCRQHHQAGNLCNDCKDLLEYALNRLEHCPKGSSKTSCRKCEIHCYSSVQKKKNQGSDALCRAQNDLYPSDRGHTSFDLRTQIKQHIYETDEKSLAPTGCRLGA